MRAFPTSYLNAENPFMSIVIKDVFLSPGRARIGDLAAARTEMRRPMMASLEMEAWVRAREMARPWLTGGSVCFLHGKFS